ncbi:FkbM family methyltransferase [Oleiharenicola sp. Vm1]|uniref:FkbM family methyltransferase n=1 Tax=Oleiharenicola sp. Vm1 TaxID=3398393 RepID=UPI0039F5A2D4
MKRWLHRLARGVLTGTGLQYWPVRARGGYNAGLRWTLYPWTSYWRGAHEPAVTAAIERQGPRPGQVCWDLGAHFGYYACGFARRVGPTGQVLAVEPFPSSHARLERHARMNRLDWLQCLRAAASRADGEAELIADTTEGDTGVHLAYDAHERPGAGVPLVRIRTVRLDGWVERGRIRPPDIVKVDVEGHGHLALAGAIESIRRSRPVLFMAFHSRTETDATRALLDPLGYRWEALQLGPGGAVEGGDFILRPS